MDRIPILIFSVTRNAIIDRSYVTTSDMIWFEGTNILTETAALLSWKGKELWFLSTHWTTSSCDNHQAMTGSNTPRYIVNKYDCLSNFFNLQGCDRRRFKPFITAVDANPCKVLRIAGISLPISFNWIGFFDASNPDNYMYINNLLTVQLSKCSKNLIY